MVSYSIILVKPQMGENIGAAARVMHNFAMDDLRIVAPRDGWPNPKAEDMSAGGLEVINNATIYSSTEEAIADLQQVYAATARIRDMEKPVIAAHEMAGDIKEDSKCGILFGAEQSGLNNDDVVLSDKIVTIPVSEEYSSLNIAQSVCIICYELNKIQFHKTYDNEDKVAPKSELIKMFEQLESALDDSNFFCVEEKRASMIRNIRNTMQKAEMTEQEVRTMRGIIGSLTKS